MTTPSTGAGALTVRDEIWSKRIQEELKQELFGQTLVEWIQGEFADGDMITIPTLASMSARDYVEGAPITVDDPTVGEFQLTIDKYYQAGFAVTDKLKQDTYYMEILTQKFPAQVVRALMERLETEIFQLHKVQTANNANTINGADHRFNATTDTTDKLVIADVLKAKLALDKANVSKAGRFAVIDPKASYQLLSSTNTVSMLNADTYGPNSNLKEGFGTTKYIGRVAGFDLYESNSLDTATGLNHASVATHTANLFCGPEAFIGAIRAMPEIEMSRDWERKRDVYHATMRWGLGLYRPEALVTILTTT
jgi:hypothetical protein